MRRAWMLLLVPVAACRPVSREVRVPGDLPPPSPPVESKLEVPAGAMPRVLRPHASVEVYVPADEALPHGIRTQ